MTFRFNQWYYKTHKTLSIHFSTPLHSILTIQTLIPSQTEMGYWNQLFLEIRHNSRSRQHWMKRYKLKEWINKWRINKQSKSLAFRFLKFWNKPKTAREDQFKVWTFIPAVTADTCCPVDRPLCLLMHYNHIHVWSGLHLHSHLLPLCWPNLASSAGFHTHTHTFLIRPVSYPSPDGWAWWVKRAFPLQEQTVHTHTHTSIYHPRSWHMYSSLTY